jgi:hypothetical protein
MQRQLPRLLQQPSTPHRLLQPQPAYFTATRLVIMLSHKGSFINYVDKILSFFDH